jgi:hypothetical protein
MLGFQLMLLIWEGLETLGGGARLEDVGNWGHDFESHNESPVSTTLLPEPQDMKMVLQYRLPLPWCSVSWQTQKKSQVVMGWTLWHYVPK